MPSLADLRARASLPMPTTVQRITTDQDLIATAERLEFEEAELKEQIAALRQKVTRADEDGNKTGPPRKSGEGGDIPAQIEALEAQVRDIVEAKLPDVYRRITESEDDLVLQAIPGGEWQRWKDEHPPREDNKHDARFGWGLLNFTDLMADLHLFAKSWGGDALTAEDWKMLADKVISPGDLRDCATAVIELQERSGLRIPKSWSGSSETEDSATD